MKTTSPKAQVVAFGELLLRLDTPGHDRFVQAEQFAARYTGGEANVAVALAQWGLETFAVSKVPAHEIGQACVNALRRYGVNTDHVLRGGDRLGILYVETGASQRASKVIYDRGDTSFRALKQGELDWKAILSGRDWLHVTGTAPALGENVRAVVQDGLRSAKRLGVTVSLDVNYRSSLWPVSEARRVLGELLPDVDVLAGTPHDAAALFDISGEAADSAQAMRQRFGLRTVAYTLRSGSGASDGSFSGLLCDAEGVHESRRYDIQFVDRVGGGDAFTAGLVYGLLSQWPARHTIEFAAAAGCLKHSIPGDFNLVSLEEVQALANGVGTGSIQR
ncbi:MAG: sugar kinase [Planctomycetes bacterium]|nr:sugar kinase [Planctomycetota bacterium]